ncbi:MAG TPA: PIG-L family deacetylase [Acetobacteraceae bacterium]|nr:PIG-L family deacetylase [Acetobacteraceae bacterium]
MLTALAQRRVIEERVALVVAHPDDETIAAGGSLHLLRNLLLVQVTDGAPRRLDDAARAGFATPEAYAAARTEELDAALALSGADPAREALGVPDQDAILAVPEIAARLRELFRGHGTRFVLTHAYEGGHPDHDAVALAVHLAAEGREVFDFPLYHAGPDGEMRTGVFLEPSPAGGRGLGEGGPGGAALTPALSRREREKWGEVAVELSPHDRARKADMLGCFRTQAAILSQFDIRQERFRTAPAYDFTAPPHPGPLNYENWGWSMTGTEWRKRAEAALGARCAS